MGKKDVQQFLSAVAETPHLWQSIDARVIALYADGEWHNLVTRFHLHPAVPEMVRRATDLPRLEYFAVLQDVYPIADLPGLIDAVQSGELQIQDHSVRYVADNRGDTSSPYASSYARLGRDISELVRGTWKYGHALSMYGGEVYGLYGLLPRDEEGLNAALRRLPDPWGGVSDVLLHALGDPSTMPGHSNRRVNVVAPLQARINATECYLSGGVLAYAVRAGSKTAGESCTLVITGIDERGKRVAKRVPLSGRRWVKDNDGYRYSGIEKVRGAERLRLTLQLGTFELGYTELDSQGDALPLLLSAFHALLPGKRDFARGLLSPVQTKAHEYEQHVALLLTYCGLPLEYIGDRPDTKEAPDLLAYVPGTKVVLVVEVTLGPLNHQGKMARLKKRAEQVRRHVEGSGGQAVPVIVTANSTEAIAQNELDAAKADNIRVISQEDILTLLGMAMRRAPVRHVAKFLVPHFVSSPLPAFWLLNERNKYLSDEDVE